MSRKFMRSAFREVLLKFIIAIAVSASGSEAFSKEKKKADALASLKQKPSGETE